MPQSIGSSGFKDPAVSGALMELRHRQLWQHAVDLWSYGGHFQDLLFNAVGFPAQMTAIVRNQFPLTEGIETGEKVPTTRPDAAMAIGTLENGALFAVQVEGAQPWRTGLLINITGTEGVLRVPTRSPCSTSTTTRSKA